MSEEQEKTPVTEKNEPTKDTKEGRVKTFRDWWSFTLSTLAFCISAAGFYFSSLQQVDDLRLLLGGANRAYTQASFKNGVTQTYLGDAVFVNAGNRSAVIESLAMIVAWSQDKNPRKDCRTGQAQGYPETSFSPLVIKPGEAVVRGLNDTAFPAAILGRMHNGDMVTTCLRFFVATPSEILPPIDVVTFSGPMAYDREAGTFSFNNQIGSFFDTKTVRPFILVKTSRFHGI
jgi:hypothetical protein